MPKLVTAITKIQKSISALFYADGSLAFTASYYLPNEDDAFVFHKLVLSPEGVEELKNLLTRADKLRNEAVDAGQGMASHTEDSVEINGTK